jgi:hypothetical protein
MLAVGQFVHECEWVSRKWLYFVHCKLCDIMIVVCWQLDPLCRNVSGSAGSDCTLCTVNCVTLWLLCVGSWTLFAGVWLGQQEMTYCVHCKLCDFMIVVCWQLDTFCRCVSGSAGSDCTLYTVNCVTLWLLYVGSWTVCTGVFVGQKEVTVLCTL